MDRHALKEQLRHDHFTDAVSNALNFATLNRGLLIKWAVGVAAVAIIAIAALWFSASRTSGRQAELGAAFAVLDTPVGPPAPNTTGPSFPTEEAKTKASMAALSGVMKKAGSSREGLIARYYLGTLKAQNNDTKGALSDLHTVANSNSECAPLAKIALAQLFAGTNQLAEAKKMLQQLINKPDDLVSKSQAQVLLAQLVQSSNPAEARKLIDAARKGSTNPALTRALDQISSASAK